MAMQTSWAGASFDLCVRRKRKPSGKKCDLPPEARRRPPAHKEPSLKMKPARSVPVLCWCWPQLSPRTLTRMFEHFANCAFQGARAGMV